MSFQFEAPVTVYNGPDAAYKVSALENPDGSFTQLVGIADDWADAFGRLRVSNPQTLFESSFTYDVQPLLYEAVTATSGTVAHDTNLRAATLTATGSNGSLAALQSRQYIPYEKGKSQLVKITFVLGAAVANVRERVGYFDANNGVYFEQTGAGLRIVRRSSSTGSIVNTAVEQADWNLDPLDGTGPSGLTLDVTKAQILVIDGQWLGVGRVRVGFNIDGGTIYVHEFLHANRHTVAPYMQTFTLPIRWEIQSTAASAGSTLLAICAEVESEGGVASPNGFNFAAANAADVNTSTTRAAILSIRPATQFPASSGLANRGLITPIEASVIVASQSCLIEIMYDATLTGGSWTRSNVSSAVEFGTGQSISVAGIVADAYYAAAGAGVTRAALTEMVASQYPLTLDVAGSAAKTLTVCATALSSTGTARAAMSWREVR